MPSWQKDSDMEETVIFVLTALAGFMAAIVAFMRIFALPDSAAHGKVGEVGGSNFLRALCACLFAASGGGVAFAYDGITPMHRAAANGDAAELKLMITNGANVDVRTNNGNTPLHLAAVFGQAKTALILVKAGANIHARDNNGYMPLHLAVVYGKGNTAIALIEAGADINGQGKNGYTALHILAGKESSDNALALALALIKRGANVKAQNDFGETPAELAISKHGRDSRIARLLRKHEDK